MGKDGEARAASIDTDEKLGIIAFFICIGKLPIHLSQGNRA